MADPNISRLAVWGTSAGGPYALATAALLPDAVASVCLFASLGPCGEAGLDFAEGMGDGFREQARNLPQVTAYFPADEDHTNVEEHNRAAALDWVLAHR